jgi:hypothetical protein
VGAEAGCGRVERGGTCRGLRAAAGASGVSGAEPGRGLRVRHLGERGSDSGEAEIGRGQRVYPAEETRSDSVEVHPLEQTWSDPVEAAIGRGSRTYPLAETQNGSVVAVVKESEDSEMDPRDGVATAATWSLPTPSWFCRCPLGVLPGVEGGQAASLNQQSRSCTVDLSRDGYMCR